MKLFYKAIFSLFLICQIVSAQSFNLDELIHYAHTHHSELQKLQNTTHLYNKQLEYSKYSLLPSVQANVDHSFTKDNQYYSDTEGYITDEAYQLGQISISGNLRLFDGLASINKIKQNKLLIDKSISDTKALQNSIKLEVIGAYFEVLMSKENIEVINNSLASTQQQIKNITISVEVGKLSKIDLLELLAQREKENSRLINAQKQYEQSIITLKKALNYTGKKLKIKNITPHLLSQKINIDSIYVKAISILPEFQQIEYDSLYWDYNIKQIKGEYLPFLSTSFSLSSSYQNNDIDITGNTYNENYKKKQQLDDNFNQQIALSLVIPLYSRQQIKQQVLESEISQKNITIEKAQLYQDLYFEIEQLCNETNKRQAYIQTLNKRLKYYTEIFEMRKEQYSHGILSITDYLIADNNVKNAELLLSYEKYNLLYNLKVISHYLGD